MSGGAPGGKTVIGGVSIDHDAIKGKLQDHFKNKVAVIDDVDKQVWELMTNVPKVSKPIAFGCAFLNLLFPGLGTLTAACSASDNVSKTQMAIALIQFLTTLFLIGWLFAAYWSYLLVTKAMETENQVQRFAGPKSVNPNAIDSQNIGFQR